MEKLSSMISTIDDFVWGPVMLILLVGTGIFLTFRTRFLTWRNLGYALKSTLSKEARTKSRARVMYPRSRHSPRRLLQRLEPAISSVLRQQWFPAVREHSFGCGYLPHLV